ncbi:hypothetical protein MMC28_000582 [Mycoblastus sanguinarius]|nr:hypothetical protein [Mycoblastus sanguinarius]
MKEEESGLLCASYIGLPEDHTAFQLHGSPNCYNASKNVTRYFCGQCGSNVYLQDLNYGELDLCTGVLEKGDGILDLQDHIFVTDTKDGGLSDWIPDLKAWEGFSKQSKQIQCGRKAPSEEPSDTSPEMQGYCQCKGVQFKITRPNESSKNLSSTSCDLLTPYYTGSQKKSNDTKWWLCENNTKYLAGTCACDSCRISSGFDIQTWAFVPKVNIMNINGEPISFDVGSLKQYRSSDGVYREFCGRCGATVFWRSDDRPELIDVSVGLLDAKEGSRAESWLSWRTDRVSFEEEAHKKDLIARLSTGLKIWGESKSTSSTEDPQTWVTSGLQQPS